VASLIDVDFDQLQWFEACAILRGAELQQLIFCEFWILFVVNLSIMN